MILQLDVPDDIQEELRDAAWKLGMDFETYIEHSLITDIKMGCSFAKHEEERKSRRQICTGSTPIVDFAHKEQTMDRDVVEMHNVDCELSMN
jgi:hypothetical protein